MRHLLPLLSLAVLLVASPLRSAETAVTPDDVLRMMDTQPGLEYGKTPYRWSKVGQAKTIAQGIAKVAPSREDAAELVVYDVREGGNLLQALGDGGHSHGPWQLSDKRTSPEVATDPEKGAKAWMGVATDSRLTCGDLPPDEQLAALASGSCEHGVKLARHRAHLTRVALGLEALGR